MKRANKILILTIGLALLASSGFAGALDEVSVSGTLSREQKEAINGKRIKGEKWQPFKDIMESMGLDRVNVQISSQYVRKQEKKAGVKFVLALRRAMINLLSDNSEKGNIADRALEQTLKKHKIRHGDRLPQKIKREAIEKAKAMINFPNTVLRLSSRAAERGESPADNWIFYVQAPALKNGVFVIVDKNGGKRTYNYSAMRLHLADYDGSSPENAGIDGKKDGEKPKKEDAPKGEIPAIEGGLNAGDIFGSAGGAGLSKSVSSGGLETIRRQGRVLYENYGAELTMVKYAGWPGNIPVYGEFSKPYKSYLANARKIDTLRIEIREMWIRLNDNLPVSEAKKILADMRKKGREYDKLVGECYRYVRMGQQLYAEGKATFPSILHNIQLVKGSTYIELYDDNGRKITRKKCVQWGTEFSFWGAMVGQPYSVVCKKYREVPVKAKVPDYHLKYGYNGDQVYPQRARMIDVPPTPAFPEVFVNNSLKRDQYDMEVQVICALDKDPEKGWLITHAKMRKGKASWVNSLGVGVTAGGKVGIPLVAEGSLSVSVNAGISWSHFRFGEMVEYPDFRGRACFELGKGRDIRANR